MCIRDRRSNLSDRQALLICTIIRRRFGRKAVTANMRKVLKERKTLLSHLFTSELLDESEVVHFKDKKANALKRHLVYCTDLLALTEAKTVLEEEDEEDEHIIGVDDGKGLLKVEFSLQILCHQAFYQKFTYRSPGQA